MTKRSSRQSERRWWVVLAAIAIIFGIVLVQLLLPHSVSAPTAKLAPTGNSANPTADLTTHMLFVGDVMWGRTVQIKALASPLKYAQITSGLTMAERDQYNAWIANFECPITTHDVPLSLQATKLIFNCRPEFLPNLAKWFTAASQANNHTDNNGGMEGLAETRQNLQAAGIQNFGTYDMSQINDICEVIAMPATDKVTDKSVDIPVALCGYMYVSDVTPTDAQLAVMKAYSKVMPVIAFPHMGIEYRPTAEPAKVSAYQRMIDNGADVVIGAHPHVIENSEVYKGRLIIFSTGNFLFDDQTLGRAVSVGLGVGIRLTISDPKAAKIYEQVGPSCKVYKDNCLQTLTSELKQRPKIGVSYNFSCFDETNGLPTLGSADDCADAYKAANINDLPGLSPTW